VGASSLGDNAGAGTDETIRKSSDIARSFEDSHTGFALVELCQSWDTAWGSDEKNVGGPTHPQVAGSNPGAADSNLVGSHRAEDIRRLFKLPPCSPWPTGQMKWHQTLLGHK